RRGWMDGGLGPGRSGTAVGGGLPPSWAVPSAMPPVAVPAGSGLDGGGAGAAVGAAGAAGLSWANTHPPTASRHATTRAAKILHGRVRLSDSVTVVPSSGRAHSPSPHLEMTFSPDRH